MPAYRGRNLEQKVRRPAQPRRSSWVYYDGTTVTKHPLLAIGLLLILTVLSVPVLIGRNASSRLTYPDGRVQAWVSTDRVRDTADVKIDIQIQQAWVFSDRMRALEQGALADAAAAQDQLLRGIRLSGELSPEMVDGGLAGPGAIAVLHSILPALNWSDAGLLSDKRTLDIVNRAAHKRSAANITLRPESVLAIPAVRFNRVVGADAVIITLISETKSTAAQLWDRNAVSAADDSRWDISRPKSQATPSGIIKIQYRPSGLLDDTVFCTIYIIAAAYLAWSIGKTTLLKSRVAQLVAVAVEISAATTLSLGIASLLGIDTSTLPWKAYPLAVLAQCVRNTGHLLDELQKTASQPPLRRVSTAYKQVSGAAFFATFANVDVFLFSSVDAPSGLTAFCHFAAIAYVVDLAFFLTFFVAVSSLNTRKLGLEESFSENPKGAAQIPTATGNGGRASKSRSFYPDVAGNALMLACLLLVTVRFHDGIVFPRSDSIRAYLQAIFTKLPFTSTIFAAASPVVPDTVEWIRSQDASTLGALVRLVKPDSSSVLLQTLESLVIMQKLAKRNATVERSMSTSVLTDTFEQRGVWLPTLALCGLILLALAIWNTFLPDEGDQLHSGAESSEISSVRCLPPAHSLDVFVLASGARRFLVSVGFDREVRLWDLESPTLNSQVIPCSPEQGVSWPISLVAIDNRAEWIAICSHGGHVALWHRQQERFGLSTSVNGRIVACLFVKVPSMDRFHNMSSRLLLVLESGGLVDWNMETGDVNTVQICNTQVRSAHLGSGPRMPPRLITISEHEGIFISMNREGWWSTRPLQFAALDFASPSVKRAMRFSVIPSLKGLGIAYNDDTSDLHFVDLFSGALIYSLRERSIKFSTLRAFHSPSQPCIYCGSPSVASFSIAYTDRKDGTFIMTTISAENNPRYRTGLICLRSERDVRELRCAGFTGATEVTHIMPDPGVWEVTGANGVAGVRKREIKTTSNMIKMSSPFSSSSGSRLVNRKAKTGAVSRRGAAEERWEAWTMTAKGAVSSHTLTTNLLTSKSGPVCRLARNAIAVGLADIIVLVQFGNHLHDNDDEEGAVNKPTHHGRLSRQNSRIGRVGG